MGNEKKKTTKKITEVKEVKEEVKTIKNKAKKVEKKKEAKKDKKKEAKKDKKKEAKKENIFKKIIGFFKGVKSEMSKVVWPSKKNMVKYSIATIFFIIIFAIYFSAIMALFGLLKEFIISVL